MQHNTTESAAPQDELMNIYVPTPKDRINAAYEVIVKWRRNLFDLPKGNSGKEFITVLTKLINTWCNTKDDKFLTMIMILPSLLLQRASRKTKGRENKQQLERRLVEEGQAIQNRLLPVGKNSSGESELVRQFRNHMTNGNKNKNKIRIYLLWKVCMQFTTNQQHHLQ